jgi:hypothetical protein
VFVLYHELMCLLRCGNCETSYAGALKGWSDTEEESSSSEDAEDSESESESTERSDEKSNKEKKDDATSDKVQAAVRELIHCSFAVSSDAHRLS